MSQILLPFRFSWFARSKRRKEHETHRRAFQLPLFELEQPPLPGVPLPDPEVVVECVRTGKSRVRVRPASPGYDPSLWCRFPYELRREGARYAVGALVKEEPPGSRPYYRTAGEIRRKEDRP